MTTQLLAQMGNSGCRCIRLDEVGLDLLPEEVDVPLELDDLGEHDLPPIELGIGLIDPFLQSSKAALVSEHARVEPNFVYRVSVLGIRHETLAMSIIQGCQKVLDLRVNSFGH